MTSLNQKQLNEIDQLVTSGKYNEAMNVLEKIGKNKLSEKDEVICNSYKVTILNAMGKYEEAIKLTDEILDYLKNKKLTKLKIEVLLKKSLALSYQRKYDEVKKLINKIELILKKVPDISEIDKSEIKTSIFRLKLITTSARTEPKKYLKLAQNCHKFAKKSNNDLLIISSLIYLARAHYHVNEKEKCIEYVKEAYQHAISIDYMQGQEDCLWELSSFEPNREKSLEYAEKAIVIHEKTDSKLSSFGSYTYLACGYVRICDFEKALISLNKAEKLLKEDDEDKHSIYFVYARLFTLKGEFNLAYENVLKAQKITKDNNKTMFAQSHYDLLLLALNLNKYDLAKKHQKELQYFSEELEDEEITQLSLLASALILKANKGIRDWSKSIAILEELLENEVLSSSLLIDTTLNLCELLIREIELTGDVELLDNIQTHLSILHEIAENQKIHWLLIEILRLKSQISLLVFNINKARELLEAALRVAQDKGIQKLTIEILNEQMEIEEKIAIWKKLQEIDAPLIEVLKHVHLLNNIVDINQETATVKSCGGTKNTIEYRKLFALKI